MTNAEKTLEKTRKLNSRDPIVDNAKGLLIILFAVVHVFRHLPVVDGVYAYELGKWFNHSEAGFPIVPWWGFNVVDLAPIAFYFLIGLVVYQAFSKNLSVVGKSAYKGYFIKNLAVMGLFLFMNFLQNQPALGGGNPFWTWSYFVGIGFTGILMLPFLTPFFRKAPLGTAAKFAAGVVILVLYNLFHEPLFQFLGVHTGLHVGADAGMGNGAAASFGFVAVVLFAAGIKDIQDKTFKSKKIGENSPDALKKTLEILPYAIATAVFYALGFVAANALKWNTDYNTTAAAYIFVAFTKFQAIYFVFYAFNKFLLKGRAIPLLSAVGRNILLYMMLTTLLTVLLGALKASLPQISFKTAFISMPIVITIYLLIAIPLEKKKTLFKL
jgi:hypothetical protein